ARAHPHVLPHRGHRPVRGLLRGPRLRGAAPDADPRRGDQRVHGPAGRRAAARADLQPRRRRVRARHGLQPHRHHGGRPGRGAARARRPGDRAREAAVHGPGGRLAAVLRPRSRRLPHRAHREGPGRL
ncbi:MAG: Lactoylglutathione lyase, partial [uncultured Solirubrobacteraceae bacterium]